MLSFSNTGHKTHQLQRKKYLQNTTNIWTSSKKKWNTSLNQDHGTMPSKRNLDLNLKCSNHITSHRKNANNRNYLSRKISRRDTFDHQDHQWHPLSFSSTRKMGNYDQHRIIGTSTNGQSRMPTHCHSYRKSWTRSRPLERNISPNSTFDGDSTMYASRMVTNGKWHSRPTSDYTNQQSCSLAYAIPLQHSKQ